MYIIDTDVIVWVLRGNKKYEEELLILKNKAPLCISAITVTEVYKNIFPGELPTTEDVLFRFETKDITFTIARQAGFYFQQFSKQLKTLHIFDCLIAATAKEYGLTLITLNVLHFPMTDIKLYRSKRL